VPTVEFNSISRVYQRRAPVKFFVSWASSVATCRPQLCPKGRSTARRQRSLESDRGQRDSDSAQRREVLAVRRRRFTDEQLYVRLFQTASKPFSTPFLRNLREKQPVERITFFVDRAPHLASTLGRLGLRFQVCPGENRNSVERIRCGVKHATSSVSYIFATPSDLPAKWGLQAFAVWWNRW